MKTLPVPTPHTVQTAHTVPTAHLHTSNAVQGRESDGVAEEYGFESGGKWPIKQTSSPP